jgi:hypothetical protein
MVACMLLTYILVTLLQDDSLWACLAAMSVHYKDLNTAEVAFAAINEVRYIRLRNVLHVFKLQLTDCLTSTTSTPSSLC